jgi:hypothetical protein
MKPLVTALMLGSAALFVFGALQPAGGAAAVLKQSLKAWRAAFIGNLVALIGVAIGVVARAVGAGPRTASNDLYHGIMLALATASLVDPRGSRWTHGAEAEWNLLIGRVMFSEDSGGSTRDFGWMTVGPGRYPPSRQIYENQEGPHVAFRSPPRGRFVRSTRMATLCFIWNIFFER